MAESTGRRGCHQQPSRLQRRAPPTLQINRSTDWNVAIPLLSPLASSPPSNLTAEIESGRDLYLQAASRTSGGSDQSKQSAATAAASFKKWQNPAAPFYYNAAPMMAPFVRVNGSFVSWSFILLMSCIVRLEVELKLNAPFVKSARIISFMMNIGALDEWPELCFGQYWSPVNLSKLNWCRKLDFKIDEWW